MVSRRSLFLSTCAVALVLGLTSSSTSAQQSKTSMTRTLASGPPFPGTRDPQEVLANLACAIKEGGFGKRHATVAQMAETPKIRRLMEVEDQLDLGDYWLLELENSSGQYIGMAAVRKDGRLRGIGAGAASLTRPPMSVSPTLRRCRSRSVSVSAQHAHATPLDSRPSTPTRSTTH